MRRLPAVLIAEDFLAGGAGDNGALRAVHGGFRERGGAPCPVGGDDLQLAGERGAFPRLPCCPGRSPGARLPWW
ncbi:hypothetical protein TA05_22055 [Citrobacter rodentium]|nr:hypothetical protein TA05_22055 [Citrobacter rodentium]